MSSGWLRRPLRCTAKRADSGSGLAELGPSGREHGPAVHPQPGYDRRLRHQGAVKNEGETMRILVNLLACLALMTLGACSLDSGGLKPGTSWDFAAPLLSGRSGDCFLGLQWPPQEFRQLPASARRLSYAHPVRLLDRVSGDTCGPLLGRLLLQQRCVPGLVPFGPWLHFAVQHHDYCGYIHDRAARGQ